METKKEIINNIKECIVCLSSFDPNYYTVQSDSFYEKFTKDRLNDFLAELRKRIEFARKASAYNANIVSRLDVNVNNTDYYIKESNLYRNVGIGFVCERKALKKEYETLKVII